MADQDRLVQVGSELTLEEPMAQDDTLQEDPPLQSNPEVALRVAAAAHEHPPHQISLSEDRTIPNGSAPDHGGSALLAPIDLSQLVEILANMQNQLKGDLQKQMDTNAQEMKRNMQNMKN